jgi:hypothetical protein
MDILCLVSVAVAGCKSNEKGFRCSYWKMSKYKNILGIYLIGIIVGKY